MPATPDRAPHWDRFLKQIVSKEGVESLRLFFARSMDCAAFVASNVHGAFDQPGKNSRGLFTKIIK